MPDMDRRKFLAQAAAVGATAAVFTTSPARGIVGLTPAAGAGARVRTGGQARTVTADVYVLAIPVEGARQVIGPSSTARPPGSAPRRRSSTRSGSR